MATPIPLSPDIPETFDTVPSIIEEPLIVIPRIKTDDERVEEKIEEPETEALVKTEILPETSVKVKDETLEDLQEVDRVTVQRKLNVKGVLFLKGKKNRFFVRTPERLVYTIEEDNQYWWVSYFCYGLRPLVLRVLDGEGDEVLRIRRPYAFTTRLLPCQLQRLQVYSPQGGLIGTIEQQWTAVRPRYFIKDATGSHIFDVHGPCMTWSCFKDVHFHIKRLDGAIIASTTKRWEGLIHALFFAPVTDKFSLMYYDKTLTGEEKSLVLAISLLFDYMYYDV